MRTGQAAKQLQVSTSTVRNWLKEFRDYMPSGSTILSEAGRYVIGEGELRVLQYAKARKDAGLTYDSIRVEMARGLHTIEAEAPIPEEPPREPRTAEAMALTLPDILIFARDFAASRTEELREQLEELRSELAEMKAERDHYLREARESTIQVARLEERLVALEQQIGFYEKAMEKLPWWRRVFRR